MLDAVYFIYFILFFYAVYFNTIVVAAKRNRAS